MECFIGTEVNLYFFQLFQALDSLHVFFCFVWLNIFDDAASKIDSINSAILDREHAELKLIDLGHHLLSLSLNVFVPHLTSVLENTISDGGHLLVELGFGWFELPSLHQNPFFYVVYVVRADFVAQN